jgi:hypothetical protein
MKKRAQDPDALTYTILLKGLANNTAHVPTAVAKALSLYHSMSGSKSKIEPNIIHTNAALLVCSRAHDMDALWSIANSIPETGPNQANNVTFTTIFNALKADSELSGLRRDRKTNRPIATPETILQARQLWAGIVSRWKRGDVMIDENIVGAMGRLLLIGGRPQDWDDVLSLVEQTMDIKRLTPPLRSGRMRDEDGEELGPNVLGMIPRKADPEEEPDAGAEFTSVARNQPGRNRFMKHNSTHSTSLMFAEPSNKTLSLVMEACEKMVLKKAAIKYWELFTSRSGYGIQPDSANCHTYLRIMRTAKSSRESVELIRTQMKHLPGEHKTYRIAMSTCVRNSLSHNAMTDAADLMDMMTNRLGELDLTVCCMWMELGLASTDNKAVLVAVERLGPQQINLSQIFKKGGTDEKEVVLRLLRLMSRGLNKILEKKIGHDEQRAGMDTRMAKIDGYISRWRGTLKDEIPLSRGEVTALRKKKKLKRVAKTDEAIKAKKALVRKRKEENGLDPMRDASPMPMPNETPEESHIVENSKSQDQLLSLRRPLSEYQPLSFSTWKSKIATNDPTKERGFPEPHQDPATTISSFSVRYGPHKYINKSPAKSVDGAEFRVR